MTHLAFRRIADLSSLISGCVLDPVELTALYLARAKGIGKPLNAYVALREKDALAEAEATRKRALTGRLLGPLDGIPIALKDNIDVEGLPTTNGLGDGLDGRGPAATADAEVAVRLKRGGAIILGKLNMHEAALGGTTDNPHHGRTHNPYRIGYSPGGSSGGASSAVAAGLCAAALGTDTAGSIRLPASYCGIAGLKPSARRVDMRGVAALHRRLDHVGPMARSVDDLGLLMQVLAAPMCSWHPQVVPASLHGRTFCVLENFTREAVVPEVALSFDRALGTLERLGARIIVKSLPDFDPEMMRKVLFLMVEVGAAVEHGQAFDRDRTRFSPTFARCLQYGRGLSAVDLARHENVLEPAIAQMLDCFAEADAIVSPTTPQAAFSFSQAGLTNLNTFSTLANVTGCPAVSVPMGVGPDGLPHGLQLMAPLGQDEALLALAGAYEAAADVRLAPPSQFAH